MPPRKAQTSAKQAPRDIALGCLPLMEVNVTFYCLYIIYTLFSDLSVILKTDFETYHLTPPLPSPHIIMLYLQVKRGLTKDIHVCQRRRLYDNQ